MSCSGENGREAGAFASQGQLRAIMLAWKAAELAVLGRAHGDLPILLLDDVSSELDPQRNEFLFEHLATLAGQCFITTTHPGHVLRRKHRADCSRPGIPCCVRPGTARWTAGDRGAALHGAAREPNAPSLPRTCCSLIRSRGPAHIPGLERIES
jgi:hypothetical protein